MSRTFTRLEGDKEIIEKIKLIAKILADDVLNEGFYGKNISL